MADPWVRPPSPGPPDSGVLSRPQDESKTLPGKTPSSDDYLLIDRLREDAAAGRMDLSSILSEATHAARFFTDATGAALALWSQGVVICRARSGDTAPPLGAKVDVDSGVSGECLRSGRSQRCNDTLTDSRVDPEVCQEMGIRSLAAVPLRGPQGVIGILEVFSDRASAFSDAHISLLNKLAKIAVMGRSKSPTPMSASQVKETIPEPEAIRTPERSKVRELRDWILRDPLSFLPARMRGEEGQPLRLIAAAVLLLVLGFFGWMFNHFRSGNRTSQNVHAATKDTVASAMAAVVPGDSGRGAPSIPADTEKTTITVGKGKPSSDVLARDLVQRASNSVVTQRGAPARSAQSEATRHAPATSVPAQVTEANLDVPAPDPSEAMAQMQGGAPPVPQSVANPQPIFPFVALPVSRGVTGGRLTRKVEPNYPTEAKRQRIEGAVSLDALVGEDGNVREVQVNSGPPQLAKAAADAVKHWRYEPFELNGKPVAIHNQITIQFKLPPL
jgi:TonB family protein